MKKSDIQDQVSSGSYEAPRLEVVSLRGDEALAGIGEADAGRVAFEQRDAHCILKFPDAPADAGHPGVQSAGCRGKTQLLCGYEHVGQRTNVERHTVDGVARWSTVQG